MGHVLPDLVDPADPAVDPAADPADDPATNGAI